ncbi:MAG: hypothetical protein ACLQNE_40665 [Thermoguttaceae bacterium]
MDKQLTDFFAAHKKDVLAKREERKEESRAAREAAIKAQDQEKKEKRKAKREAKRRALSIKFKMKQRAKKRARRLVRLYGLTVDEHEEMIRQTGGEKEKGTGTFSVSVLRIVAFRSAKVALLSRSERRHLFPRRS